MTKMEAEKLIMEHRKEVITYYIKSSMMDAVSKYLDYRYAYFKRFKNENHHRELLEELFSSFADDADNTCETLLEILGDEL